MNDFDYVDVSALPQHMQGAVKRYLNDGIMPGDLLTAALENNLVRSYGLADETNLTAMRTWAEWLWMECPGQAWGSPERVREWAVRRVAAVTAAQEASRVESA